jgi:hypothetical protein
MGFLDNLKESLTPRPDRYDPPAPEPWVTAPARPQLTSGDNEVYIVRVPYPAEGTATVDFVLDLMRPAKSIYYPVIMNPDAPLAAFAFNPQGINLAQPIPSTINNPLFDLVPGQLYRWKTAFNRVYVSVNGAGVGGFLTLLVSDGMELITANPAQTTTLRKHTNVETKTPLAANAVFTGAWHDSQVDGVTFVMAYALASNASAGGGFVLDQSDDISNPGFSILGTNSINVAANTLAILSTPLRTRYWRVRYTNGATPDTSLEITTCAFDVPPIFNGSNNGAIQGINGPLVPVNLVAQASSSGTLQGDNQTSVPFFAGGVEAFTFMYGGAFSGTANAALQGYSKARTPTVFKVVTATAAGSTALWTPGTGNKFRLLAWRIVISQTTTLAAAGDEVIKLLDSATDIAQDVTVRIAAAAGTSGALYDSGWQQLGTFGVLSAAANNVLNVNLGTACATGGVQVLVAGTEE